MTGFVFHSPELVSKALLPLKFGYLLTPLRQFFSVPSTVLEFAIFPAMSVFIQHILVRPCFNTVLTYILSSDTMYTLCKQADRLPAKDGTSFL